MAKKITRPEPDAVYFLKILFYFILGTIWLKYNGLTVVPVGMLLGLVFASHDHFRIDRKMEYLILIVSTMMGLAGFGLYLVVTNVG